MARRRVRMFAAAAAAALSPSPAPASPGRRPGRPPGTARPRARRRPTKVVIIVVDSLSKEIVDKYRMKNVKALMQDGVDTPRGYLGHTGSVTVVTHNVITSGQLPKHMGWTDEGYRDVAGILGDPEPANPDQLYITSNATTDLFKLQQAAGYPKLADYLGAANPAAKTFTISPKGYAGYAFGGAGSDSLITFSSGPECTTGGSWRKPGGINVPSYILGTPCSRFWVHSGYPTYAYDTTKLPAVLYPLDSDRYIDRQGPRPLRRRRLGRGRGGRDHAQRPELERHLRDAPGRRQGRAHVGRRDRPRPDRHGRRRDDPHGQRDRGGRRPGRQDHGRAQGAGRARQHPRGAHRRPRLGRGQATTTASRSPTRDYGYYNWYYGDAENDLVTYNQPQDALLPLVNTGNVGLSYSDSMLRVWLKDQSPAKVNEAAAAMQSMAAVTAVWRRHGDHYDRVSPVRWDRMKHRRRAGLVRRQGAGAGRHRGRRLRAGPDRHAARRHDVLRRG